MDNRLKMSILLKFIWNQIYILKHESIYLSESPVLPYFKGFETDGSRFLGLLYPRFEKVGGILVYICPWFCPWFHPSFRNTFSSKISP